MHQNDTPQPNHFFDQQRTAKVAVVLPVYNTARYLRECLDSILAQSYKNLVHLGSPWNAVLTFKKKSGRLPPRKKVALTPNFRQIQVTREEPRKKDERYDQYCRATFQISRSMARLPDHFFQDSSLARRWQEDSNS